ncbi:MAG: VWA domain-containing protein [bacterium]|nr:VWA domain-containing protein [bacterium]
MSSEALSGNAVTERVVRLGRSLQAGGATVAMVEIIDAVRAASAIDLSRRSELRVALRATMVKHSRHHELFDAAFDRHFPPHPAGSRPSGIPQGLLDKADVTIAVGDLPALAVNLVEAHAGLDGERRSEGHHIQRAYRGADLARMMSDARRADPSLSSAELRARIDQLKRLMAAEVRARLGPPDEDFLAGPTEDIEFLNASRAELDQIREAVRPLARVMAARLTRKRRSHNQGRVNLRRTTRQSLGTGGVPFNLAFRRPRPHRPELLVLCDISGSVAEFSLFTLTLMSALSAEVAQARSFVFVDRTDEITDLLKRTDHSIEPWQIMRNTNVIADDGHSDYGAVLQQFHDEVVDSNRGSAPTLLITGDARTNYRDACPGALEAIARRCRRIYWLNPEPRAQWDTEDSEMSTYAPYCHGVFEVRSLRQLISCVEDLL